MRQYGQFTALDALRFGFDTCAQETGICVGFAALVEGVSLAAAAMLSFHFVLLAQIVFQLDASPPDSYVYAFGGAYLVVRTAAQLGVSKWLLAMESGARPSITDVLGFNWADNLPNALATMAASMIYTCFSCLGCLVLVVPGLVAASTLRSYRFLIADENGQVVDSLRDSYELSREHKAELVNLNLLCCAIKLLGLCFFVVGILPASVVCGLAEAHAYRQLLSSGDSADV